MRNLRTDIRGVLPIAPTPFNANGELVVGDIEKLVSYYLEGGVSGITILGNASEVTKLNRSEVETIVREFMRLCRGKLPVIVGVNSPSLTTSTDLGEFAVGLGADGVLLQPITGLKEDDAVIGYFRKYIEQTNRKVPVCVQDYPAGSDVHLSVSAWLTLARIEQVFMLKHEPFPGLQKLSRVIEAQNLPENPVVPVMASSNCLYLAQELVRGAHGAITGVALSDMVVQVETMYREGRVDEAFDLFDALLPVHRHEAQASFGHAVRKEILRRRNALTFSTVRYPGAALTPADIEELETIISRFEAAAARLGVSFKM